MKKIAILSAAALIAATPSFAGSLAGVAEDSDPFVAEEEDRGISPLIIGLGAAAVIAVVVASSGSSSGTAPQTQDN